MRDFTVLYKGIWFSDYLIHKSATEVYILFSQIFLECFKRIIKETSNWLKTLWSFDFISSSGHDSMAVTSDGLVNPNQL